MLRLPGLSRSAFYSSPVLNQHLAFTDGAIPACNEELPHQRTNHNGGVTVRTNDVVVVNL